MHTPIQKYLALTVVLLLAPMVTGAALADADAKPSNVIVRPEAAKKFATMPDGAACAAMAAIRPCA
jgi:hypothetical protein